MSARTSLPAALAKLVQAGPGLARTTSPWPGGLRETHSTGFYDPPAEVVPGEPGTLVWWEPMTAYLLPGIRFRARAYRVLYRSTTVSGAPSVVAGTILVPRHSGAGAQPLIAYAPGTHGLANGAAPSRLLGRGLEWEGALIGLLLARGYAVAVTDYAGLGTPGDHPYVVGRALGRNVLDVLRAARALEQAGLQPDGPLAVIGYSEGGNAAGWAAELQPVYAPELNLAGVVAGSVPADLEHLGDHMEGSLFSFFAGYGAIGLNAAYPELGLERYLTEKGARHMHGLRRSSIIEAAIRGPHFAGVEDLMTENVLRRPDWQARLRENSLGFAAPAVPVYIHTSIIDPIVPPEVTRRLAAMWREQGADVTLVETVALEHGTGAVLGSPAAIEWLAGRLRVAAAQDPVAPQRRRRHLRAA